MNGLDGILGRVVIVGASGFLGSRLFADLSEYTKVVGTYFSRAAHDLVYLDIRNEKQVRSFLRKNSPELLIMCGGMTRPDLCETHKKRAFQVNVSGTANLVNSCDCKIIYFSTDYVFDGEKGCYVEDDVPNPINHYGRTKLEAEEIVLKKNSDNVVLRVSGLYGYSDRNNEFINSLLSSPIIFRAVDCYSCNLLLDDIVENLEYFVDRSGLFHLTDGESLSRYEFSLKAVETLDFRIKVLPKSADEIYRYARRPRNSTLASRRHKLTLHDPDDGLRYLKRALENHNSYQNMEETSH